MLGRFSFFPKNNSKNVEDSRVSAAPHLVGQSDKMSGMARPQYASLKDRLARFVKKRVVIGTLGLSSLLAGLGLWKNWGAITGGLASASGSIKAGAIVVWNFIKGNAGLVWTFVKTHAPRVGSFIARHSAKVWTALVLAARANPALFMAGVLTLGLVWVGWKLWNAEKEKSKLLGLVVSLGEQRNLANQRFIRVVDENKDSQAAQIADRNNAAILEHKALNLGKKHAELAEENEELKKKNTELKKDESELNKAKTIVGLLEACNVDTSNLTTVEKFLGSRVKVLTAQYDIVTGSTIDEDELKKKAEIKGQVLLNPSSPKLGKLSAAASE